MVSKRGGGVVESRFFISKSNNHLECPDNIFLNIIFLFQKIFGSPLSEHVWKINVKLFKSSILLMGWTSFISWSGLKAPQNPSQGLLYLTKMNKPRLNRWWSNGLCQGRYKNLKHPQPKKGRKYLNGRSDRLAVHGLNSHLFDGFRHACANVHFLIPYRNSV